MWRVVLATVVVTLAAVSMSAAAECVPDTVNWTPTPTLRWTASTPGTYPIAGYRLYWRWPPDDYCCYADLPCTTIPNDDTGGTYTICPGADFSVAPQKYTNTQLWELNFAVKAYDTMGNFSVGYSNEVPICMPILLRY